MDLGKHFHSIPVPKAAVAAFFQVIEPYHVFLRNAMPSQEIERREWIDLRLIHIRIRSGSGMCLDENKDGLNIHAGSGEHFFVV